MKLAVVGAGSTYTPELVSGLSRVEVDELWLHDIDAERLEVVGGLAARMLGRAGYGGALELTGELDRAVEGADFVLIQIRVGGQAARFRDETVPLACGCIGQETTGAGGFAKAMRTVPVVLEIADRVRALAAPGAWIVDFTNPVGIVTRALLDAGHRAVGLCNVAIGFQRTFARWLEVEPARVVVDQVGLNHLTWVRAVRLDGEDVLLDLVAEHGDELGEQAAVPRQLVEELGAVPSYYLRYFYAHDRKLAEQLGDTPRAARVAEIEAELLELLDGVMQAPGGPEEDDSGGFAHGGWSVNYWDEHVGRFMDEAMSKPFDLVLGRKTYDIFAAYWPHAPEEAGAKPLNDATKYVASRGHPALGWSNSVLIEGDVAEGIAALKEEEGPELQVHGSGDLIQTLLRHNLIDQYRLLIFPVLIGSGRRLFSEGTIPSGLRLLDSTVSTTGVVMGTYEPAGEIVTGSFAQD